MSKKKDFWNISGVQKEPLGELMERRISVSSGSGVILFVGVYLRRSTDKQYGSLEAQAQFAAEIVTRMEREIKETGHWQGVPYDGVEVKLFYSDSESSNDRIYFEPGTPLFEFIEAIRLKRITVAVVAVLDRLWRQARREDVRGAIQRHFADAKVRLITREMDIVADRSDPKWTLLVTLLAAQASSEQNTIMVRTLSQRKRLLQAGNTQNFPTPPFGLSARYNPAAKTPEERYLYERVPGETIAIMEIYRLALGLRVRHIPESVLRRHFKDGVQEGRPVGDSVIAKIMNEAAEEPGFDYLSKARYDERLSEFRMTFRSRRKERGDAERNEEELSAVMGLFPGARHFAEESK